MNSKYLQFNYNNRTYFDNNIIIQLLKLYIYKYRQYNILLSQKYYRLYFINLFLYQLFLIITFSNQWLIVLKYRTLKT